MVARDAVDSLFDVIERKEPPVEAVEGEPPEEVDIILRVHVQAGAGRTTVVGRHGDALKVKVAAPPEGGRANEAVVQILASTLGVAPSGIVVVSGATSRSKRFRIGPVELEAVRRLLSNAEATPLPSGGGRSGNLRSGGGVR